MKKSKVHPGEDEIYVKKCIIALSQKCFARVDRRGVGSQVGVSPY
jgi:hypothetical protein